MPNLESFTTSDARLFSSVNNSEISESAAKAELLSNLQRHVDAVYARGTNVRFEDFTGLFHAAFQSKVFNIHKEKDLDDQFKINNTKSKQKALGIVRDKALLVFEDEFRNYSAANDYDAAEKRANFAVKQPIFSLPRQNWFKVFAGITTSQRRIYELYNNMQDEEEAYKVRNPDYRRGRSLNAMTSNNGVPYALAAR
jgi:hypothetical protein